MTATFANTWQPLKTAVIWLLLCSLLAVPLAAQAEALLPFLNNDTNPVSEGEPLPPDQAFKLSDPLYDGETLYLRWEVAPDYYLYRHKMQIDVLNADDFVVGEPVLPEGKHKEDEFFGDIQALYGGNDITLPLKPQHGAVEQLEIRLAWQGCADSLGVCYPPDSRLYTASFTPEQLAEGVVLEAVDADELKTQNSNTPSKTASPPSQSEQNRIAAILAQSNILWVLLSFFGFGLLLSFTPCVFPMIPILSGIIAGQKNLSTRQAFLLSLTYVLAMALTYTFVGVLAGLFGANLQILFQNPWILVSFSALFVLLALSMFGFYDLQMPAALQSKLDALSKRQSGGTFMGVAVMGVLSALIVGPCVAAPLMGALIYIGQTGDAVLGGLALFALSLGMGVPLLLIGTGAGRYLPRAGAWMDKVKAVFGVLLLGVAIWLLERILPAPVTLALWAALLVCTAVYMGAVSALPAQASGWQQLRKGLSLLVLAWGLFLLLGAAAGHNDPLQPLKGLFGGTQSKQQALSFRPISSVAELDNALQAAQGQPVMLEFYADWCVSCKEMERYTFSKPQVQTALRDFVLLKADVTANTAEHQALLKQFSLYGPPATLFFNAQGQELAAKRLVGFMAAEPFAAHVQQVPSL